MKLVSVSAVLIGSGNISLFLNSFLDTKAFPSVPLFLLSTIYILLVVLLEYQHRQFKQAEINIRESSYLLSKYLYLFAVGLGLTLAQKSGLLSTLQHPQLERYTLLGSSIHYSLLYYTLNLILGIGYHHLFCKQYQKANRTRVQWEIAGNIGQNCSICLNAVEEGQRVAKIQCMHRYHLHCLNKWLKKKTQCPLCLSTISLVQ